MGLQKVSRLLLHLVFFYPSTHLNKDWTYPEVLCSFFVMLDRFLHFSDVALVDFSNSLLKQTGRS